MSWTQLLRCDYISPADGGERHRCERTHKVHPSSTIDQGRQVAAGYGWTRNEDGGRAGLAFDLCPDHSPKPEPETEPDPVRFFLDAEGDVAYFATTPRSRFPQFYRVTSPPDGDGMPWTELLPAPTITGTHYVRLAAAARRVIDNAGRVHRPGGPSGFHVVEEEHVDALEKAVTSGNATD